MTSPPTPDEGPAPRLDPRTLGPRMDPDVARVESALEQAAARGDFDDLPGAGKPLQLPDTHDPDWWVNQRLADGTIDREALLPVVVLLRKEYEHRAETLAELPSAQAAREYAADFTERVHQDRRRHPFQTMLAPAWEEEDAAAQWRTLHAERTPRAEEPAPPPAAAPSAPPRGRRRWWRLGRRG